MTVYTGDILLAVIDESGDLDMLFENGQPNMTNGLETCCILAVLGEDNWQNEIVKTESEKMKSGFPNVIKRNVINDKAKNDGTQALKKSLAFLVSDNIAKSVNVTGEIMSVFGIAWLIEIEALTDNTLKFFLNWERGELTARFV